MSQACENEETSETDTAGNGTLACKVVSEKERLELHIINIIVYLLLLHNIKDNKDLF